MPSRYPLFDRSRLSLAPLAQRRHDLDLSVLLPLAPVPVTESALATVAERIQMARAQDRAVILMMGAHVLRAGVQRYLIDLMARGMLSCVAMNGAGAIHDFELALIGATTESVATYIREGRFGLWRETGRLNEIVAQAAAEGLGFGEAVGRVIEDEGFPNREISVLAAGYRLGVPVTVHVGIGQDIVHELPNCDGAAVGAASYCDFLIFAKVLERLAGGVVMNFGSAVMAPEVFLKALAMVRNVAARRGAKVENFVSLVCDLLDLPRDCSREPVRDDPRYFFRPWKTMLARTVAGGGMGLYVKGSHRVTFPQLWSAIVCQQSAAGS